MKSKTILNFLTAVFAMTAFLSLFCLNVYAAEKDNADTFDEVIGILHEQYTDEEVDVFLEQYSEEELILMYEDSLKFECAYVSLWAQFGYLEAVYAYVETYNTPWIELLDTKLNAKVADLTVLPSGINTGITFNFYIKSNWSLLWNKTFCNFMCDCYGELTNS
ncbi:MAG: hypothetical protein NC086_06225 [Alistipes sp.]|nr:hypothetical protein [Alistipes sp.]